MSIVASHTTIKQGEDNEDNRRADSNRMQIARMGIGGGQSRCGQSSLRVTATQAKDLEQWTRSKRGFVVTVACNNLERQKAVALRLETASNATNCYVLRGLARQMHTTTK